MNRVYATETSKKPEINSILESDPYSEDSFARVGYKLKDGSVIDEDQSKVYVFISASEDFIKKADERMKDTAEILDEEATERIANKIKEEEEAAASGFGDIFG
jgi:hypothetical protein